MADLGVKDQKWEDYTENDMIKKLIEGHPVLFKFRKSIFNGTTEYFSLILLQSYHHVSRLLSVFMYSNVLHLNKIFWSISILGLSKLTNSQENVCTLVNG